MEKQSNKSELSEEVNVCALGDGIFRKEGKISICGNIGFKRDSDNRRQCIYSGDCYQQVKSTLRKEV